MISVRGKGIIFLFCMFVLGVVVGLLDLVFEFYFEILVMFVFNFYWF